jgi:hypothetical protein
MAQIEKHSKIAVGLRGGGSKENGKPKAKTPKTSAKASTKSSELSRPFEDDRPQQLTIALSAPEG